MARNNNAKRAQTLGRVSVQKTAKMNSMNSPWRRQAHCSSAKAMAIRARMNAEEDANEMEPHGVGKPA